MPRTLCSTLPTTVLLSAAFAWSQSGSGPHLPDPRGPFGIGRTSFHWIDTSRADPFSTDRDAHRDLMVYVWYPTAAAQGHPAGMYQPRAREVDAAPGAERLRQSRLWTLVVSGRVTSHARENAPLVSAPARWPIVLFSHGDVAANTFTYTGATEDLVSRGFVVVAIEHPYSSAAVAFPDGRVVFAHDRPRARGDRPSDTPYFEGVQVAMREMRQLAEIEAADLRFISSSGSTNRRPRRSSDDWTSLGSRPSGIHWAGWPRFAPVNVTRGCRRA